MIDRAVLLSDLHDLLADLEADLRERCEERPEVDAPLREEYRSAREGARTAQGYEAWRDDYLTQVAVAWILGCVFVRFMEDNGLIEPARLAGPGEHLKLARDHHTVYFQQHAVETDREYLLHVFRSVAALPAAKGLFDEAHNPLWRVGLSGDGAARLLDFWRRVDGTTGRLVHDFTDPAADTRFLGDLYQDLSESARKKYALLQTPVFVEEFILDRTLTPAIQEFGYQAVRLIDPACGSGHFLLGAFRRLFDLWVRHEPGTNVRELARRALDQVYGVDLNPFAVAIARFRLLVAALRACDIRRLANAPAFRINLSAGDSLLHGPRFSAIRGIQATIDPAADPLRHVYAVEDADELQRILGQQYQVVVGNPPYITVKDAALNQAYRDRFGSCHRQYSLVVPFMERFFELALPGNDAVPAGFVGLIAANSFMKREFGKKLIEEFIPRWDLTHVIDTSGAYIPGHGTPTVIILGRNREPIAGTVRAVMGIRGEPGAPDDPAKGRVWSAIVAQIDHAGSQSDYVSVADTLRAQFHKHPWSLGGGGAADLRARLDEAASITLLGLGVDIGFLIITGEDNCLLLPPDTARRHRLSRVMPVASGEIMRDWYCLSELVSLWPYSPTGDRLRLEDIAEHVACLWPYRTSLKNRKAFGEPVEERGIPWWTLREVYANRLKTPLSIAFAFVATHNHFVLDRGGKVFNRSAPVIKLAPGASEDDHLALLGLLNSSTACFWMKQIFHCKGAQGINEGGKEEKWEQFYEFDATKVKQFPVPHERPVALARELDRLATALRASLPGARVGHEVPSAAVIQSARCEVERLQERMVALQEELDWECHRLYGLVEENLGRPSGEVPGIRLGERAFEIVMARKVADGVLETTWFERHRAIQITEIPNHWPEEYRLVVERRIQAVESNPDIALIEQPEYKRRWNVEPWDGQQERAVRTWLLGRLESSEYWPSAELTTCARLADRAREDTEFIQVAELYRSRTDFDVAALVRELVELEAVPFLSVLRYSGTGMRKRMAWEETWRLQRLEDAIDARGKLPEGDPQRLTDEEAATLKAREMAEIPVPPKYTSADFLRPVFWGLRGKLDVPKERFISYPGSERTGDPTPVIGWAGWDHLQQAQALAGYYVAMRETEGWPAERLAPLLAGLLELVPWLRQWHNDLDPAHGVRLGDYYSSFLDEEARALGLTLEDLRGWVPGPGAPRRGRRTAPAAGRRRGAARS